MSIFVLLFLCGMVLGLRFKILALVPALSLVLAVVVAAGILRNDGLAAILLGGVLATVCLETGYVGGILIRYAVALMRGKSRITREDENPLRAESAR